MTLSVLGLTHSFGPRLALDGASFVAPAKGVLTALIGPNAAGKSTLFRAIAGMLRPSRGRIALDDDNINTLPLSERTRRIAFMPQAFACNAALTVFEVVMLAKKQLSGWSVGRDDRLAVASLLDRMEIGHLAEAHIGELSGGQSQLVSAAQALVRTPQVFLFDEPTSALDLRRQLELLALIRAETQARNIVSFVALHDLNLASRFADEMILMRQGTVLAQGTPETVLADQRVSETYGVGIDLFLHPKSGLQVSAFL